MVRDQQGRPTRFMNSSQLEWVIPDAPVPVYSANSFNVKANKTEVELQLGRALEIENNVTLVEPIAVITMNISMLIAIKSAMVQMDETLKADIPEQYAAANLTVSVSEIRKTE